MDDLPLDPELASVERHIVSLSRRVEPDPSEYARLRQERLRRHQERRTETTQRAVRSLWPRLTGVKRLTLVAPPALAAAVALFAVLAAIQISGHQSTESAQAAQITRALSHTVPTITAGQVNVQHERGDSTMSLPCPATRLGKDQRLVMRDGRTYWYSGGQWY